MGTAFSTAARTPSGRANVARFGVDLNRTMRMTGATQRHALCILGAICLVSCSAARARPTSDAPTGDELSRWVAECRRASPERECEEVSRLLVSKLASARSARERDWLWACSQQNDLSACEREYEELFVQRDEQNDTNARREQSSKRSIRKVVAAVTAFFGALISGLVGRAVWRRRIERARSKLAEIDAGLRCLACDGTDLATQEDRVECRACGYIDSLRRLRSIGTAEADLERLTKPHGFDS